MVRPKTLSIEMEPALDGLRIGRRKGEGVRLQADDRAIANEVRGRL